MGVKPRSKAEGASIKGCRFYLKLWNLFQPTWCNLALTLGLSPSCEIVWWFALLISLVGVIARRLLYKQSTCGSLTRALFVFMKISVKGFNLFQVILSGMFGMLVTIFQVWCLPSGVFSGVGQPLPLFGMLMGHLSELTYPCLMYCNW